MERAALIQSTATKFVNNITLISGRVDKAYAFEAVDCGSILGRVKPKTIKIAIHNFPA